MRNKITEKVDDKNVRQKESKISPEVKREITVLDKIENCKLKLDNRDETQKKDVKGWISFFIQAILTILIGYIAIKLGLK